MTKSQRRAAYPELAAFADDIREHFPEAEITHTRMPGYEYGERMPEGVKMSEIVVGQPRRW